MVHVFHFTNALLPLTKILVEMRLQQQHITSLAPGGFLQDNECVMCTSKLNFTKIKNVM